MQTTTNYGFNIVEGTDIVNPLTQLNPNFTALDSDLKAVSDNTVDNATCIKTGTVHAVTRVNTDAAVFKFTATGNWNAGDTMTVDGTLVSVYLSDGSAPSAGCFVINSEVLAAIQGTRVTLYANSGDATLISFDDTSVGYTASNVQTAIEKISIWTNITVPTPTQSGNSYTYSIPTLDKYRFAVLDVGISNYGVGSAETVAVRNDTYYRDYTDEGGNNWRYKIVISKTNNTIEITSIAGSFPADQFLKTLNRLSVI